MIICPLHLYQAAINRRVPVWTGSTLASDFEIEHVTLYRENKCWIFFNLLFSCLIPRAGIRIRKWWEHLRRHGRRGWSEEGCGGESVHHGVYICTLIHSLLPTQLSGTWTKENSSCPSRPDKAWNKEICAALLPAHRRRQIKMEWGSRGAAQREQQISLFPYPLLTVVDAFTFTLSHTYF